ncbi:MAG TPA: tetratricopeptide repeat protein [Gemmataceae bacterium]|nr:tetratricopeptide repeat protein [Gemmataceae bacterium]
MQTRLLLLVSLILPAVVFGTYLSTASHQFLDYDDRVYVTANAVVQQGLTRAGWCWAWTTFHYSNWHPLTWLSHMLDCQLFGLRPLGPHLVNVALHAANTLLLLLVLHGMTRAIWRPALAAGLFALHPLHVESVAWVAERKDVLSTFFGLLALGAYLRYVERPRAVRYVLLLAAFALSLLAKPMLVTLPCVLLLLDYWPLRRLAVAPAAGNEAISRPLPLLRLVLEKVPLLALSLSSCLVALSAHAHEPLLPSERLPLMDRLANMPLAYGSYLRKTIWPVDLAIFYPASDPRAQWKSVLAASLVLVLLTELAVRLRRRQPAVLVGWLWFLGTLLPVLWLLAARVLVPSPCDRYSYFPLIGIFIALAWGIPERVAAPTWYRAALGIAGGGLLLVCAVLTQLQLSFWYDEETVWRHALQVTDNNAVAHQSLGTYLFNHGRTAEGIRHLERALRIDPDNALALHNLGLTRLLGGQDEEALELFRRAVDNAPRVGRYQDSLGLVLALDGHSEEARACFQEAIRLGVEDAEPYYNLAATLDEEKEHEAAAAAYAEALRHNPAWPVEAHRRVHALLSGLPPWSPCPRLVLWRARQVDAANGGHRPDLKAALAAAFAANDRMPEAAAATRQALAMVHDGDARVVQRLQAAIRYYEAAASKSLKSP